MLQFLHSHLETCLIKMGSQQVLCHGENFQIIQPQLKQKWEEIILIL